MSTPPGGNGIQISFEQLYSEVRLLHDAITRIETKLDSVSGLEPRVRELEKHQLDQTIPDHEDRLRKLEARRIPLAVVSGLAAVLSTAAALLALVFNK